MQEQEVVGQEGDSRRRQRGPQSIEGARRQNRRQIDDAQVHTFKGPVQQEGQSRRRNHAGDADGVAAPPSGQVQAHVFRRFRFRLDLVGDDVNGHASRLTQQFGGQRPAQPLRQAAVASLGQNDLGDMVVVSVIHDGAHHVVTAENHGAPAQLLGQFQRIGQLARRADAVARARRPIDMSHGPGRVHHHVGHAPPCPHQRAGHGVARHQDQDALARSPRPGRALFAQTGGQLIVHCLGCAAQRQFAQRRQILDLEEVVRGQPRRLGHIDLALGQTLAQLLGGDVHQLDVVGARQGAVGHALALADARDAQHHVRQAFQMLDVQCGPDVDPGLQNLLHVLPPLRMARTGRIGMGVFVDQQQVRAARYGRVNVELQQGPFAIGDGPAGHHFQPAQQAHRLLAAVGLDHANDDVLALGLSSPGGAQHLIGLADAWRHAQKDLQPPTLARGGRGLIRRENRRRHPPSVVRRPRRASSA
ncbi:hypothetical protein BDIM_14370 [Brevundimonas diminuta ATCC 11568]|nr:hypothetical protein BDIM_14370 [Brevundimonas diminuta ATCC 11568]